ncbi:MAG: VCBS repeat-containing protein [Phycisphaerae bacterium]|nr:VCBS repeat-containing protein [Phycisphaerae bacterium]
MFAALKNPHSILPTVSRALAVSSVILTVAAAAQAQVAVDSSSFTPTGANPSGAALGDFTGDGFTDIATTIDGPDRIQFLVGDGLGSFTQGATIALGTNAGAGDILAVDIDGDGDLDLAACLKNQNTVGIFRNLGGGSFALVGSVATGSDSMGPDAADFDLDGDMDIVVANRASDTATVLKNDGAGSFTPMTFATGADPRAAAFGDFDSDGDLDVAVTSHDDRTVQLHRNNAGTSFSALMTLAVSPTVRPEGIDTGDLNGDGLTDIAVATSGNAASFATVFLRTRGTFSAGVNYPSGGLDASSIVIAELDCDGDADVAVVNQSSNNVALLANNGSGVFGAAVIVPTGSSPDAIAAGDLDGDLDNDLAIANQSSNTMSVLLVACPQAVLGDLNNDGVVNSQDLGILLGGWDTANPLTDLDGDGITGGGDLAILLGAWA